MSEGAIFWVLLHMIYIYRTRRKFLQLSDKIKSILLCKVICYMHRRRDNIVFEPINSIVCYIWVYGLMYWNCANDNLTGFINCKGQKRKQRKCKKKIANEKRNGRKKLQYVRLILRWGKKHIENITKLAFLVSRIIVINIKCCRFCHFNTKP